MKKIFAFFVIVLLLASVFCITSLAADGKVCVVSGLKADGTLEEIGQYGAFVDGWNKVADLSVNSSWMKGKGYERIVMDLYKNWVAKEGEFCDDGIGFSYDAIYVPENARVMLNLNGYTINRAMSDWEWNGEVMYIDENADVIINNGTVTGGWSGNGAGGLHIMDKANVTLNNVHVDGNNTDDDNGAGIAIYGGATLVMNGGSISNNKTIGTSGSHPAFGGGIYSEGGNVVLDGVEIKNNRTFNDYAPGMAIYAIESEVTLKNCIISENGIKTGEEDCEPGYSAIHLKESKLTATKTKFTGNGSYLDGVYKYLGSSIIRMEDSAGVTLEECDFEDNDVWTLFQIHGISKDSAFYANKCNFLNNRSSVYYGGTVSVFKECTFDNNKPQDTSCVFDNDDTSNITFMDCSMGDSTYAEEEYIEFENATVSKEQAVMGVSVLFGDGSTVFSQYYKTFEAGWDAVEEHASSISGYERVVVDFYGDWNSNAYDVVTIPENARMTINLNGHKIDRATEGVNYNGEVLYISANADVIINDGTITGGYSRNGAGGIHIKDNARVILNNVNVDDNNSSGTNGAAIAVYNGATLVMNGGSLSDNRMESDLIVILLPLIPVYPYGTLYVNDATATLNNVTISGNRVDNCEAEGAAIYADNSTVTLNDCVVSGNIDVEASYYAESVIGGEDSTFIINNTDFIDNGDVSDTEDPDYCSLFELVDCKLTMKGGKITDNHADKIFYLDDTQADINGVTVTGNASIVLDVDNDSAKVTLTECTLGDNEPVKEEVDVIVDVKGTLVLTNCELSDTTFEDERYVDFGNDNGVGSIFGAGSLTMIVAILALIASAVSIFLIVDMKKKFVPVTANSTAENEE